MPAQVQHAVALHLATVSHSPHVRRAFAVAPSAPLGSLYRLEQGADPAFAISEPLAPHARRLRDEALEYARWSLHTSQGRNYKPDYDPPSFFARQAAKEASVQRLQAAVRGVKALRAFRTLLSQRAQMASSVQAHYRGVLTRREVAAHRSEVRPAAARAPRSQRPCPASSASCARALPCPHALASEGPARLERAPAAWNVAPAVSPPETPAAQRTIR